jgi:hypothetical protein
VDNALATQLITVGATLGGVVLTLVANAFLERRRAREAHRLESLRTAAEHSKWLRDERMKAYAAFSLEGEEVLRFLRVKLPAMLDDDPEGHAEYSARWYELRADLRKAYNQVQLLGAEEPRAAAVRVWRLVSASGNDLRRDIAAGVGTREELLDRVRELRTQFGEDSNNFLAACRSDIQGVVTQDG